MRTVYAIQLQLELPPERPVAECYAEMVTAVCRWIEGKYERTWSKKISVPLDGKTVRPFDAHLLHAFSRTAGDSQLFELYWTHPADNDPWTAWVTNCVVAYQGDLVQIALLLRISTTRVVLRPVRFDLGRPRLVTDILSKYRTTIDGWAVPSSVETLAPVQVPGYVDEVLLNDKRTLPVIMISPDVWYGKYAISPDDLFERLRGFAHVTVLTDKWAAFKLTDSVDKHLSCFDGAVRVYWPGFKLTDNPFQHKLFLAQSIRYHSEQGLALQDRLFRTLAAIASFRYIEGGVIRSARRAIVEQEKQRVEELRELVKAGAVEKDHLETQLLDALDLIDSLEKERDKLKSDLTAQQVAWAEVQQAMAMPDVASPAAVEEVVQLNTVYEALEHGKKRFSGPLIFLDSALESAKDSVYRNPDRVYQVLEALHEVAIEWRRSEGRLGESWKQALSQRGFDVHSVSQTSSTKWRKDYTFSYKNKGVFFGDHITLGAKQADKCCSIHWYRDDVDRVLVIGYCGEHLPNKTT